MEEFKQYLQRTTICCIAAFCSSVSYAGYLVYKNGDVTLSLAVLLIICLFFSSNVFSTLDFIKSTTLTDLNDHKVKICKKALTKPLILYLITLMTLPLHFKYAFYVLSVAYIIYASVSFLTLIISCNKDNLVAAGQAEEAGKDPREVLKSFKDENVAYFKSLFKSKGNTVRKIMFIPSFIISMILLIAILLPLAALSVPIIILGFLFIKMKSKDLENAKSASEHK